MLWKYLIAFSFDFLVKILFAMFHKVVLHSRHELPHVSHDDLWIRLLGVARACDEVVDVLRECGALVLSEIQSIAANRRADRGFVTITIPQCVESWCTFRKQNNYIKAII